MALTIATDDDTGMVVVEECAEIHSAAGLQWPQRGSDLARAFRTRCADMANQFNAK